MAKLILCTGGAGYIGGHTVIELYEAGYEVVIFDNYSNSSKQAVEQLQKITGRMIKTISGDLRNVEDITKTMSDYHFEAVIHFAGSKAVGASVSIPMFYYENNFLGSMNLLKAMEANNVKKIVFSSSATVYKPCDELITEDHPLGCTNPYGWSKFFVEQLLRDYCVPNTDLKVVILRYFNPIGAHPSGEFGESPVGMPNNLMPYVQRVAYGTYPCVYVFGNDWETRDGTGVRDYIDVLDLAAAHVQSLEVLDRNQNGGCYVYNVGTGTGYSVLEMIKTMEVAADKEIPYKLTDRRPGDLASVVCCPDKAMKDLNWKATKTLEESCKNQWKWQCNFPKGFSEDHV